MLQTLTYVHVAALDFFQNKFCHSIMFGIKQEKRESERKEKRKKGT
jgi:hypothetical protein